MTCARTLRRTGVIFCFLTIKKLATFAMSKDKSSFGLSLENRRSLRLRLEHRFRLSIVRASSTLRSAHAIFDLLIQIWIEIMIVIKRMRFFSFLIFLSCMVNIYGEASPNSRLVREHRADF